MRQIPAKCRNCGYLFPSGYSVEFVPDDSDLDPKDSGFEATLTVKPTAPVSTPCPMCGRKKGRVLSGEYNFVKDTITLLSGPDSTKDDLERLIAFLRKAQDQGASVEEIREGADREIPALSHLIRKLLESRPAQIDPAKWLPILISLTSLMVQLSTQKPEPSQTIYEINNYNYVQCPPVPGEEQCVVSKVGPNDPCPCQQSGKKFKKCHGDPSAFIQPQP